MVHSRCVHTGNDYLLDLRGSLQLRGPTLCRSPCISTTNITALEKARMYPEAALLYGVRGCQFTQAVKALGKLLGHGTCLDIERRLLLHGRVQASQVAAAAAAVCIPICLRSDLGIIQTISYQQNLGLLQHAREACRAWRQDINSRLISCCILQILASLSQEYLPSKAIIFTASRTGQCKGPSADLG